MPRKRTPRAPAVPPPTVATEDAGIVRANVANREVVVSPTFVSLYANDVQIQTSPWDIRLILGEIDKVPTVEKPNVVTIRQIGELRLSLQLTKKLVMILADQLQSYEKRFGTIPVPSD